VDPEALAEVGRHRLAQRRDADRRRVAVMAIAQRLDRGLDDEVGRAEIGLADAEIDDVAALRRQRLGTRQHRKGGLFSDAVEGGNGFQHGTTLFTYRTTRVARTRATSSPPPPAGEGQGGGMHDHRASLVTPSPPLPRKREREQTELVARATSITPCAPLPAPIA